MNWLSFLPAIVIVLTFVGLAISRRVMDAYWDGRMDSIWRDADPLFADSMPRQRHEPPANTWRHKFYVHHYKRGWADAVREEEARMDRPFTPIVGESPDKAALDALNEDNLGKSEGGK